MNSQRVRRNLSFEDLLYLETILDIRLCTDQIQLDEYNRECNFLLCLAGLTQAEYIDRIDRRWDYLFRTNALARM